MICRSWVSAALSLAVPACAHVSRTEPAVVPGLAIRFDPGSNLDTVVFRRSITRAGRDSAAGTRTVVLQVVQSPGNGAELQVEQRFPGGGGQIVDTAIASCIR